MIYEFITGRAFFRRSQCPDSLVNLAARKYRFQRKVAGPLVGKPKIQLIFSGEEILEWQRPIQTNLRGGLNPAWPYSFLLIITFKFRDPYSPVRVSFAKDLVRVKIGAHHDPSFWRSSNINVVRPLTFGTFPRIGCHDAWRHTCGEPFARGHQGRPDQ